MGPIKLLYRLKSQIMEVKGAKSFQNEAFHAPSESVLISQLASSSKQNKTFAVNTIMKVRGNSELGITSVRSRKKYEL